MRKKILSLMLVFTMVAALMVVSPTSASAESNGTCGNNLTWTLDDSGKLTISGTGAMSSYTNNNTTPWYSSRLNITSVEIGNGVTRIGERAFYGCKSLTSVTIPKGVTSIGEWAFRDCKSLTSVTIPEGVTSIGDNVFFGCDSLTSVTIPEGVTSINNYAFRNCESLTSVTIPEGVTSIGENAFSGCKNLTNVTIPNSVTSIGGYAFYGCSSLTSVTIPEGVTSIGGHAFYNCSLTSVTIPEDVTSINTFAFRGCSLTNVTIPNSVTSIGEAAFYVCKLLTDIYYNGTEEQWNKISIGGRNDDLKNAAIHFNASPIEKNETGITVKIDEKNVSFDQPPIIVNGRTLVPLRAIFEALGAEVEWNSENKSAIGKKDGTTISFQINNTIMIKNDVEIILDVPAQLVNDRTLVPVRAISESFNCNVDWNGESQTVMIATK